MTGRGDCRKNIIILSAPSATGKNTVYNAVKELRPDVERAITVTTRAPRKNEKDGVDYYFLTDAEFQHGKGCRKEYDADSHIKTVCVGVEQLFKLRQHPTHNSTEYE